MSMMVCQKPKVLPFSLLPAKAQAFGLAWRPAHTVVDAAALPPSPCLSQLLLDSVHAHIDPLSPYPFTLILSLLIHGSEYTIVDREVSPPPSIQRATTNVLYCVHVSRTRHPRVHA